MKKSHGITLGIGAVVAAYFLTNKLNPPSLIVNNINRSAKTATAIFDGTEVLVGADRQVDIPGRNDTSLKVYATNSGAVLNFDLYKSGKRINTLRQIQFA